MGERELIRVDPLRNGYHYPRVSDARQGGGCARGAWTHARTRRGVSPAGPGPPPRPSFG